MPKNIDVPNPDPEDDIPITEGKPEIEVPIDVGEFDEKKSEEVIPLDTWTKEKKEDEEIPIETDESEIKKAREKIEKTPEK
ncbi:hypothetical protein ACFL29_02300 [Patescibacteria group bacterium]